MSTHDFGSTPDHGGRGPARPPGGRGTPGEGYGYPPGHDPAGRGAVPDAGGPTGYDPAHDPGFGDAYGTGLPPGADGQGPQGGYGGGGPQGGYGTDPRGGYDGSGPFDGRGDGFAPGGPASGQGYDPGQGEGQGFGQGYDDPGQGQSRRQDFFGQGFSGQGLSRQGFSGQGFSGPGDGYGAGYRQDGGTYGAAPDGGPEPFQDPAAYGAPGVDRAGHAPARPDGWSGAAGDAAQRWEAAPAGTWEHAGAGGHGYDTPQQWAEPQPPTQPYAQPHAFADPQPYAGGSGIDHTAVLRVVEETFGPMEAEPGASAQGPVRTGSPIIPPGIRPAGLTAVLGLLLAGGAAVGKPGLTALLVVLQAVTAAGWFRLNGMWPARQGILLAFLSGVAADVALLAVDGEHGTLALAGTLGVWLVLVLVLQLRHHGSAEERLSSLTATSAATLLTVLAACYLATATSQAGTDPVVVGAIAVAAATVVRALPLPGGEPVSLVLALAAATATAPATGPGTGFGGAHAALLAVVCGVCALIGLRVASYDFPSRFVHFTAGVALPLTAAAPLVLVLGRALN